MPAASDSFDPYLHDRDRWGVSLAQLAGLIIPCLDAVRARTVTEIGAFAGDLTRVLVAWAEGAEARILAIDPSPQEGLVALERESERLELVRETSLSALTHLPISDVVVIDGDHNYYTVSQELRLLAERATGNQLPLLLFHDVCWPHGRRDDYFDPRQIPDEYRHELVGAGAGIVPGHSGVKPRGLPYPRSAAHEGGPRNGVLSAAEDFVRTDSELRLVVVPAFFGLGAVWHRDAPWGRDVAAILEPWDRNPILTRLEENRLYQLADRHALRVELWETQQRLARHAALLDRLAGSSAFMVAERLSSLRVRLGVARWQNALSREEIRRTLSG
jgi:hypothetical protein